jgi:HK97 family phage portal protein
MWTRSPRPRTGRAFTGIEGASIAGVTIPPRSGVGRHGTVNVTEGKAMTHSAVWSCLRIRADLISTFPADVLRDFEGIPIEMAKPPIMVDPGGLSWDFVDWMWASQRDLDMTGNAIGLIRERNGYRTRYYPEGLPSLIELQDPRDCAVIMYKGKLQYRIGGKIYEPAEVYHERQYPMSGSPVGMSPLIHAAATIGEQLSLQQYGLDWFAGGGVPKAWMQNTAKRLGDEERDAAKQWWNDTVRNGDLMVTGKDWEYNMIQAETAGMEWLEGRRFGVAEICRFFGVPPEMVHGAVSGQSITYANVTQANLQFLIMHLGPAVQRREKTLTKLLPEARYVKLNTDALLRMDPVSREQMIRSRLETWTITNSEARALENQAPLSPADMTEMQEIYGKPKISGGGGAAPASEGDPGQGGGPGSGDTVPADQPSADVPA